MWMVSCLVVFDSMVQLCISFAPLLKAHKNLWVGRDVTEPSDLRGACQELALLLD